jgi:hypothetical protein
MTTSHLKMSQSKPVLDNASFSSCTELPFKQHNWNTHNSPCPNVGGFCVFWLPVERFETISALGILSSTAMDQLHGRQSQQPVSMTKPPINVLRRRCLRGMIKKLYHLSSSCSPAQCTADYRYCHCHGYGMAEPLEHRLTINNISR